MDTIGFNYYAAWYEYPGYPDTIPYTLSKELEEWNRTFGKPFFMSEYGAGAVSGIHMVSLSLSLSLSPFLASHFLTFFLPFSLQLFIMQDPPTMFTEDYQV